MKRMKKLFGLILAAGLLVSLSGMTAFAKEYTYRVTIDGGNQGVLTGTAGLEIKSASAHASLSGGKIVIEGLKTDDVVSFNAQAGAVSMQDDGKYYIQGIRRSGRDTEELAPSSFRVTEDVDYVVAYGIKGDLVSYVVNYEDNAGNALAPSQTYYGNVGDKPVVANVYIEGYSPRALALTKTLSANEAENVFTFVYEKGETEIIEVPGETTTETIIQYVDRPAGQTGQTGTTGTTGTGGTGANGEETQGGANAGEAGGEAQNPGQDTEDTQGAGEQEELVDLDEEETPLANLDLDEKEVKKGLPLAAGIAIAGISVVALIVLIVYLKQQKKKRH